MGEQKSSLHGDAEARLRLLEPYAYARQKMTELFSRLIYEKDEGELRRTMGELDFTVRFYKKAREAFQYVLERMPSSFGFDGVPLDSPLEQVRGFVATKWHVEKQTGWRGRSRLTFVFANANGMELSVVLPAGEGEPGAELLALFDKCKTPVAVEFKG